ncbi:hypothetical protein [Cupriavidus sp. 8B]
MEFRDKQIAPPKSWSIFEDLCHSLFCAVWGDIYTQKNGRSGQPQHGVDIYGSPNTSPRTLHGVQCKGKDQTYAHKATERELRAELRKAESFSPRLDHWTLATSAPNDAELQRVAREISAERQDQGKFPVTILGWESIQSLLADHPGVIEKFYPEHTFDLAAAITALRQIPNSAELAEFREALLRTNRHNLPAPSASNRWTPVTFNAPRDLGPALMGRALGPADVGACPVLPEAVVLVNDLERGYSARLTGLPGAGKSVCGLQAARILSERGWNTVRLTNPAVDEITFADGEAPTLHLIDDAHLTPPSVLQFAEQMTSPTKWLLSMHTITEGPSAMPGATRLDTRRAVKIIADSLRSNRAETLRVVRRADDRVGDKPLEESLDERIREAEKAELPWQFCFVLGGGWRRAAAAADSARAAGTDLVLAAAAIHQLASRDARCRRENLDPVLRAAGIDSTEIEEAVEWLLSERLLLNGDDLRCPHQRFSAVLLERILQGQDTKGRNAVGALIHQVLDDSAMPLAGLNILLQELRLARSGGHWTCLIEPARLDRLQTRCWNDPDQRHAAFLLSTLSDYLPRWPGAALNDHIDDLAAWITNPAHLAGYGIGRLMNHVYQQDPALAQSIVDRADPEKIGHAISHSSHARACEIASMVSGFAAARSEAWKRRYLAAIDQSACIRMAASWPENQYLSYFGDYCKLLAWEDEAFGLELAQVFISATSDRLRADPLYTFHEIEDVVWHVLRLYDPLGIYVGKRAPTKRMRAVGRQLASCWSIKELAQKLSACPKRNFQSAAALLSFLHKAAPKKFHATVDALDWDQIEATIGDDWRWLFHDAEVLMAVCFGSPAARPQLAGLIERNLHRIDQLPPRLALIAPQAGYTHVAQGGTIALSNYGHFHWELAVGVLAHFANERPQLVNALLSPHEVHGGKILSNEHPSWFQKATTFLRLLGQVAPDNLARMLGHVHVSGAERGWANALNGKGVERQSAAFLVHCAIDRADAVGEMARKLRRRFPKRSIPSEATLAPLGGE